MDMSKAVRPELSSKNKYWVERERYYELKHFCLQYRGWKNMLDVLDGLSRNHEELEKVAKTNNISNPTEALAMERAKWSNRIDLVEKSAKEADEEFAPYILKGVTEGVNYDHQNAVSPLPMSRDTYYILYRRFFWILDQYRD